MMETNVILLSEVDDYLKIVEYERELLTLMKVYAEQQELQLRRLESIKTVATLLQRRLQVIKKRPQRREEILAAIRKYARVGY